MFSKREKRQLMIFVAIAYGITYLLGILMWEYETGGFGAVCQCADDVSGDGGDACISPDPQGGHGDAEGIFQKLYRSHHPDDRMYRAFRPDAGSDGRNAGRHRVSVADSRELYSDSRMYSGPDFLAYIREKET